MYLEGDAMSFLNRLSIIERSFNRIEKANKEYLELRKTIEETERKITLICNLSSNLKVLQETITVSEKQWRTAILAIIECEIGKYLNLVYPADNYMVNLDCDIKYGKIKINAAVSSSNFDSLKVDSQGRLFKQVVSIATVAAIMKLKGVRTIYIDEAFSGASKENMSVVAKVIQAIIEDGISLVLIIQNEDLIPTTVSWHSLHLTRTIDNCTQVQEEYFGGDVTNE